MFAAVAEIDASFDPNLKAIVEAPRLVGAEPPILAWKQAISVGDEPTTIPAEDWDGDRPRSPALDEPEEVARLDGGQY